MFQTTELISLGFTETEARTYFALLELGSGTVTTITHRADITRTLGYHSLNRLVEFGLIEQKNNSNPIQFHVKHPKKIIDYVEKQKQMWGGRIIQAQTLLPKLESLYTMLGRPYLSNRIGKEEVFDLYRILYTSNNSVLSILNPSLVNTEILNVLLENKKSGGKDNVTCIFDTPENRLLIATHESKDWKIHWVNTYNLPFGQKAVEIVIAGDTLYTITEKEGELCVEGITHESTVNGMYTLLYTLITKGAVVSHETKQE